MEWYNIVFFHVFKRYYKNGRYKNDVPWLTASVILGMSSLLYLFSLYVILYYSINNSTPEIKKYVFLPLGLTTIIINCLWFIGSRRYLRIYERYRERLLRDKKSTVLSWTYVFGGYALFILVILLLRF